MKIALVNICENDSNSISAMMEKTWRLLNKQEIYSYIYIYITKMQNQQTFTI